MEPVKVKRFVMVGYWWRVEEGANHMVNKIPETLAFMGSGVEVRSLYVWYFVHHVEWFMKVILMESGDEGIKKPGLGCYYVYSKTLFIAYWFSSYIFNGGPMRYPNDIEKFLIQFWSNTPVYIYIVTALELLWEISYFFLAHHTMAVHTVLREPWPYIRLIVNPKRS